MFNKLKKMAISNRAQDEILYEYVLEEIEKGIRIKGLWAKALAHSDGIESKAEAKYMQYRVQSIKDQFDALKIAFDEMSRESLFNYIKNGFKDPILEEKKAKEGKEKEESEREREEKERKERFRKPLQKEAKSSDSNDGMVFIAIVFVILFLAFLASLDSKKEQQHQSINIPDKIPDNPLYIKIKNNTNWIDPSPDTCEANGGKIIEGVCTASWDAASNICNVSEGRLPTSEELREVVSDCKMANRYDTNYQLCYRERGFNPYTYWSNETINLNSLNDGAWYVYFKSGFSKYEIKNTAYTVRCVSLDKNLTSVASTQKVLP